MGVRQRRHSLPDLDSRCPPRSNSSRTSCSALSTTPVTSASTPHRDFYLAAPHLGAWQPPSRIKFGRDGKPYFQQGPYDNPTRVTRTLDRSVGPGNYDFTTVITTDEP